MQRTELADLGEFGLIDKISQNVEIYHAQSVKGIGDDAAVIECNDKEYTLISTDLLIEGIHFDLSFHPLKHLGYKAVAVNLSDICAMNGIPKQITVSLALSNRFSVEGVEDLYEGIKQACKNYKVDLVGGDTTSSPAGLLISITAIGVVDKSQVVYRNQAKVNDLVCVTGDLGGAYVGLQILLREKQVFVANPDMKPELEGMDYMIGRQLRPEARTDIVYELHEKKVIPTSMIDISDGLASELLHICRQSNVGAMIFEGEIPIDNSTYETAVELSIPPITCMMNGGEDYELLFTVAQSDYDEIRKHPDISIIGYIADAGKGVILKSKAGTEIPITAQGWKHF
jgi:thiamine-monophosphate kinase